MTVVSDRFSPASGAGARLSGCQDGAISRWLRHFRLRFPRRRSCFTSSELVVSVAESRSDLPARLDAILDHVRCPSERASRFFGRDAGAVERWDDPPNAFAGFPSPIATFPGALSSFPVRNFPHLNKTHCCRTLCTRFQLGLTPCQPSLQNPKSRLGPP